MVTAAAQTTTPAAGGEPEHGQEEDAVTDSRPDVEPESSGPAPRPRLVPDVLALLVDRERARHHSELVQTLEQIRDLSSSSTEVLLSALDDELAAVATAAIGAMSILRRDPADLLTSSAGEDLSESTGDYLARVASLTRSLLAIHLTLEAQVRTNSS
ncbi:hypothetical protein Ae168Ps1_6165c [Pseudonocardia sp. Ae168_Ps1]|uniref:hypothetical protein n=1 Tax=unclassified Pseudonocardia TaxID=2619320 RepID=UPI0009591A5A|nr:MULTISPECIES: hypothetical protein [unclassified Pseudonocardia]OLL70418.1 hypothetical protein Ae168Ps1_6165c [Pseudonocardia sp. Ae168_Ps1]OLL71537.1 hypothetical protein Ae263Ps1_6025c [Pseudonocardia sp. Ae263_Ps1]